MKMHFMKLMASCQVSHNLLSSQRTDRLQTSKTIRRQIGFNDVNVQHFATFRAESIDAKLLQLGCLSVSEYFGWQGSRIQPLALRRAGGLIECTSPRRGLSRCGGWQEHSINDVDDRLQIHMPHNLSAECGMIMMQVHKPHNLMS